MKELTITNGCVNKPGCNSEIIYVLPYLETKTGNLTSKQ